MNESVAAVIEVEGLVKKFGDFAAVDGISFSVAEGVIFALLGPNGAGKTTTIKLLTTVLSPTAGRVRLAGIDPFSEPLLARRTFGIVFQDPTLDDQLTARENMELHGVLYGVPRRERRERIAALLRLVGLSERARDRVREYSGGMMRRLEIARALLHLPRILFLDEPTSGLDPQTRNQIWRHIGELCRERGVTVLFTTHYMEEAERVADQLAVIDRGRVVAEGSPQTLILRTGKTTLEEAFIELTGRDIREEEAAPLDRLRLMHRVWGSRR